MNPLRVRVMEVGESVEIEIDAAFKYNRTGVIVTPQQRYRFEAIGSWVDWNRSCGPEGYASPNGVLRAAESYRRYPKANWFCLIGCVDKSPTTFFEIGTGITYEPMAAGELMCFANDCAWFYWNNSGQIRLRIMREK